MPAPSYTITSSVRTHTHTHDKFEWSVRYCTHVRLVDLYANLYSCVSEWKKTTFGQNCSNRSEQITAKTDWVTTSHSEYLNLNIFLPISKVRFSFWSIYWTNSTANWQWIISRPTCTCKHFLMCNWSITLGFGSRQLNATESATKIPPPWADRGFFQRDINWSNILRSYRAKTWKLEFKVGARRARARGPLSFLFILNCN